MARNLENSDINSEFSRYTAPMLPRTDYLHQLSVAAARSPVTALLGPRQCGKTTLARQFAAARKSTCFDLESEPDVRRLANPELALGGLDGLVVLDEIQRMPRLFNALRVLVDRTEGRSRFLILGQRCARSGARSLGISGRPCRVHRADRIRSFGDRSRDLAGALAARRTTALLSGRERHRQHGMA